MPVVKEMLCTESGIVEATVRGAVGVAEESGVKVNVEDRGALEVVRVTGLSVTFETPIRGTIGIVEVAGLTLTVEATL